MRFQLDNLIQLKKDLLEDNSSALVSKDLLSFEYTKKYGVKNLKKFLNETFW